MFISNVERANLVLISIKEDPFMDRLKLMVLGAFSMIIQICHYNENNNNSTH